MRARLEHQIDGVNPHSGEFCNICNRPKRKRDFEASFGALSGADICPASWSGLSDAAGPVWCSRIRLQINAACSMALCCRLVPLIPSHDRCAKLLLALLRSDALATDARPTPPQPETGRRRPGPSEPRQCAPSCWPARHAPASVACATAFPPARCRIAPKYGRAA